MKKYIALLAIIVCYLFVVLSFQEGMVESSTTTVKLLYTLSDWTDSKESISSFLADLDATRFLMILPFDPSRDTSEVIDIVNGLGTETDPKMVLIYVPALLDVVKTELFELTGLDSPPSIFAKGLFTFESGSEIPTEADYTLTLLDAADADDEDEAVAGKKKKKGAIGKAAKGAKKVVGKASKIGKKVFKKKK
jgi:hypothetical protein